MARVPINSKQYPQPAGPQQNTPVYYDPNQYDKPIGPARPTTSQKIQQSVRNVAKPVASAANAAYDAGAQARQVGHDIGNTPAVRSMRSQDGFTAPVQAAPRHSTSRQQYPGAPVNDGSVMHPGNTTYIIKCQDGQCNMTERKSKPKEAGPRRRQWQTGGLGGSDPGF